ncbi:hypothetical protein HKX48_007480 [Thoreauomyces humboldtii]|nr:hypothetical protein HKX48_007480 [Thoreauomyces humboldtii]
MNGATGGGASSFESLFEQSRKLTNHTEGLQGFPQLERGLEQIDAESKRLYKKTTRIAESSGSGIAVAPASLDARTIYMFANRGYDPEKVRETLDSINLTQSMEPLNGVRDTDIEGFLKNEYQNIVTGAILETKRETGKAYEQCFDNMLFRDWEKTRNKVFQELGQHHHTPYVAPDQIAGFRGSQSSSRATSVHAPESRPSASSWATKGGDSKGLAQHPRMAAYSKVVRETNDKRRTNQSFDSLVAFWEAAAKVATNEQSQRTVVRYWSLLFRMLGGDPQRIRDPSRQPPKARQFAQAYASTSGSAAEEFRQKMTYGARAWLEQEYRTWLSGFVRNRHAALGGTPTVHDEVRSALQIRLNQNGRWLQSLQISDNQPFWAHVYTLVRCGLLEEANDFIEDHGAFLHSSSPDFPVYFRAWMQDASHRLPSDLRTRLMKEWNSKIRDRNTGTDVDPFKMALFKIIGRCDMAVRSIKDKHVMGSAEDYVWLQLMLTQEHVSDSDAAQEVYTLRDVAVQLQRFGPNHFNNPTVWIQVLLLSGEFELAVSELFKQDMFSVDAIHFAIAMVNYGVLRVPDSPTESSDGKLLTTVEHITRPSGAVYQKRNFNFAQLIKTCGLQTAKEDPLGALQYVLFLGVLGEPLSAQDATRAMSRAGSSISEAGGRRYTNFAHKLVREIVLASGEFEALVGDVRANGTRVPGEVERYQNLIHIYSTADFKQSITIQAAEKAEQEGHFQDAIRLHNLAGEHGRVIELLNRQLSDRLLEQRYRDQPANAIQSSSFRTSSSSSQGHRADVFPREEAAGSDPAELAQQVLTFYTANPQMLAHVNVEARQTCEILLALTRFQVACSRGQQHEALNILLGTGIVPVHFTMDEVQQKANDFRLLDDAVTKVMPDVLSSASTVVFELNQALVKQRVNPLEQGNRQRELEHLRNLAKAFTLFAGSLQYRIPGDTLTIMNRMLVLMG